MKKLNLDRDLIIVDVETTGVCPKKSSVIQIGAVKFSKEGQLHDTFNVYIKPYKPEWTYNAEKIHKISKSYLDKNGINVKIGIGNFVSWANSISKKFYIGQWSCGFDTSMLKSAFEYSRIEYPFSYRAYDIASIVRFYLAMKGSKPEGLIRCAKSLKIDTKDITQHNAEDDAKLAGMCLKKVVDNEFQ